MHDKPVALVTGANQGIGLQIAKDLVAHGFTVLVGSRNLDRGVAAAAIVVKLAPEGIKPNARSPGFVKINLDGYARDQSRTAPAIRWSAPSSSRGAALPVTARRGHQA